ncbi:hypothetical protein RB653_006335 [Dictyostelium firmibasis]|uniref:Uncharacterized protein n=1 Tax=Dictyostelium firmibasis TaxID=79012 RepID=A0AAN7YTN1_9MYCE
MGNNHSRYEKLEIGTQCQSLKEINSEKVGDVYLILYSEILECESNELLTISNNNNNKEKPSSFLNDIHYTIVIDVAGESTIENGPMGLEIHIVLEKKTKKVQLCFERKTGENKCYQESSICLGKIENIYHKGYPLEWSFGLTRVIQSKWFQEFIKKGDMWSFETNCFTFSKFLVESFKFQNPYKLFWPH